MTGLPRLRTPEEDGGILAVPPLEQVGAFLAHNRRVLERLEPLRQQARQVVLEAARAYLHAAGEPLPDTTSDRLLLAGHQPELCHPGVWVKNFALNGLARRHHLTPLNLIVDNDHVKSTSLPFPRLRLPLPAIDEFIPSLAAVPFAPPPGEKPWEELTVTDEALFAALPERTQFHPGYIPLLGAFWEEAGRQSQRTPLLGERFAAARRWLERRWGCHNLEVPISILSGTPPFLGFVAELLAELPRFQSLHNEVVRAHRHAHGIRSRLHPVPDLAEDGEWLETPFWGWHRNRPLVRHRLFARLRGATVELRADLSRWPSLPLSDLAASLQQLQSAGYKIRPRALTNTLFARLYLADLFIHGIGGGKYDELTDELIRRFYALEPPRYLVLSATLRLPLPSYPTSAQHCRELAHELHDLRCNPERHPETVEALDHSTLARKHEMLRLPATTRRQRRGRFHGLSRWRGDVQERLAGLLAERQEQLRRERALLAANVILQRRDYPFVLYPEATLRSFFEQFLEPRLH